MKTSVLLALLIFYSDSILARIAHKRIQHYASGRTPCEDAGFDQGAGKRGEMRVFQGTGRYVPHAPLVAPLRDFLSHPRTGLAKSLSGLPRCAFSVFVVFRDGAFRPFDGALGDRFADGDVVEVVSLAFGE